MLAPLLDNWIAEGITVEITEADVIADLDSWFLAAPDRELLQDSER